MDETDLSASHVFMISPTQDEYHIVDQALGTFLSACFLLGTAGNLIALKYFIRSPKKSLPTKLYTVICCMDLCTCFSILPVIFSALDHREPWLFEHIAFCGTWTTFFEFLQRSSIFLVMLLTLTRAIAITIPFHFHKVKDGFVLGVFAVYCSLRVGEVIIGQHYNTKFIYLIDLAYCVKQIPVPGWLLWENIIYSSEIGFSAVVITISFIVSLLKLWKPRINSAAEESRRVSTTIAIFTLLFLACNMPFFLLMILYISDHRFRLDSQYPGKHFQNPFIYWHSWSLTKIGCVALNATLNPVLYYLRMSGFKRWIRNKVSPVNCAENNNTITSLPQYSYKPRVSVNGTAARIVDADERMMDTAQ